MNAGPAHLVQDEEAIISGIKKFTSSLDDADFDKFLQLYSEDDLKPRVDSYNAAKEASNPDVSVHFYRLSQILRDMLFTCSSIDFASEMNKQSQHVNPNFPGTRLYTLNQSMLAPLFRGAGMPYLGVAHGSDTNYIFNGVFPEGQVSEDDMALSRKMTEMLVRFAATGDPNEPGLGREEYWSQAFQDDGDVQLQVIGGPLGTGPVRLVGRENGARNASLYADDIVADGTQQIIQGYQVGEMGSRTSQLRHDLLAREKLFERCTFVNSLSEKLGV